MPNVIIVLPGTTGSTLLGKGGGTVWPDVVAATAVAAPATAAAIMENKSELYGTLTVGVVAGWKKQSGVYYTLITQLAAQASATAYCANPADTTNWGFSSPPSGNIVVGFPYDWRNDNTQSAASLQAFLSYINKVYGSSARISLIGHSMGGLVSRTYLEVLGQNDPWFSQIVGLVTFGTPHLGAPLAMQAMNGTIKMETYVGKLVIDGISIPLAGFDQMVWDFVDYDYGDSTFELLPPPFLSGTNMPTAVQFVQDQSTSTPASYSLLDKNGVSAALPAYIASALQSEVPTSSTNDTWTEVATGCTNAAALLTKLANAAYGTPALKLPPYYCIYGLSCAYPTSMGMTYVGTTNTKAPPAWSSPIWFSVDTVQGGDQIVPVWSATFQGGPVAATYRALQPPVAQTAATPPGSVNHLQLPGSPDAIAQTVSWLKLAS